LAGNRAVFATLLSGPSSARKAAARMPMGTLISAAIPTITRVPTMAFPNPPPISKPAGGRAVRVSRLSRVPPRVMSI
jgi:hypothetical protein